jgi:outer membrane lipoprotein
MKRYFLVLIAVLLFMPTCVPVFREDIMKNATLNPPLSELNSDPRMFEGKLYILGGKIISVRVTKDGSLMEAIYAPVDTRGYLQDYVRSIRFLALYSKERGILDPLIFRKDRDITIAGIYKGTRTGRLEEMDYPYGYFEIVDFRLWDEPQYYPAYYSYPYGWYDPWYDPWYRHHRWR